MGPHRPLAPAAAGPGRAAPRRRGPHRRERHRGGAPRRRPDPCLLLHLVAAGDRGREHRGQRRDAAERARRPGRGAAAARRAGDRPEALPRPVRELRPDRSSRHAVPGGAGAPAVRQLLLRAGGHPLGGGGAARVRLVRPPPPHDDRVGARQLHEHGRDARALRDDLPGGGTAVRLPRLAAAVERDHRRDRRAAARASAPVGGDDPGRGRPGVQHRQRRRVPLAAHVGRARGRARRRARSLPGAGDAAGGPDARRRPPLGRDRGAARTAADPARVARVLVALRRRPRPPARDVHRHGQEPALRVPGLPELRAIVPRPVRPPARGAGDPVIAAAEQLTRDAALGLYRRMRLIRAFEETVQRLFLRGEVHGTTHLYIGQEAVATGVGSVLTDRDRVAATYRGHGHALAIGVDPQALLDEMLGRQTGVCSGRAGSMNVIDLEHRLIGSFGIIGGSMAAATGAALALRRTGGVAVAYFGDGATNHGYFHECLNFAAVNRLPVLFVCENNLYGEFTPWEEVTAGRIIDRPRTYGIEAEQVDGMDVFAVRDAAQGAVARARAGDGPVFVEALTYRFVGHSRSDPAA